MVSKKLTKETILPAYKSFENFKQFMHIRIKKINIRAPPHSDLISKNQIGGKERGLLIKQKKNENGNCGKNVKNRSCGKKV